MRVCGGGQEAESEGRNRPVHLAATNNHEQCVHVLLQRGAIVTCKNDVRALLSRLGNGGWRRTARTGQEGCTTARRVMRTASKCLQEVIEPMWGGGVVQAGHTALSLTTTNNIKSWLQAVQQTGDVARLKLRHEHAQGEVRSLSTCQQS